MYNHEYLDHVLREYSERFKGMFLLNPTTSSAHVEEQVANFAANGYVGFRINPYLWPEGQRIDNDTGKSAFAAASRLNMTIGIMAFHGLLPQIEAIDALCSAFPSVQVVLDHFGFVKPDDDNGKRALQQLLLNHHNIYIKLSALFRISQQPYPFEDVKPLVVWLVELIGPERILFGTDFPFVTENGHGGYGKTVELVQSWLTELEHKHEQPLRSLIMADSCRALFGLE
eukprot:TRINITY_DN17305_c0_g1_i1.p1 TRINITY_DN17305_c0_g1~~TRINITY_DN17305_c0_g1_i1.p1  ORF type:complete len:228 (+),score=32.08 TRINITY_DN17305_c0_g1_i1:187-870(+)